MKRKTQLFLAPVAMVALFSLAACGGADAGADTGSGDGGGSSASGSVAVDGSSTVFPMSERRGRAPQRGEPRRPGRRCPSPAPVAASRSSAPDETDISDASRPIEEEEVAVCEEAGIEYTELQVATDALTVVVHPDLAVDCLTTDQLIELWAPGSKVTNWKDLDPSFPDQEISLFGPGTDSGTYDYMAADVIGDESETTRDDYEASEDDNVLVQGVAGTEGATGYFGYTYYEENTDTLKALGDRRRQRLRRAVGRDRAGRRVHPAGPAAVHLRQQRQVQRQRGRQGVRRLLHREPRRDRRGRASSSRSATSSTPRRSRTSRASARADRRILDSTMSSITSTGAGPPSGTGLPAVPDLEPPGAPGRGRHQGRPDGVRLPLGRHHLRASSSP